MAHFRSLSLPDRVYYVPNGRDFDAQELLFLLYPNAKVFGCADLDDYKERRFLASELANQDAASIIRREVADFRPSVILLESAFGIDVKAMKQLKDDFGVPLVMFYGDAAFHPEHHLKRVLEFAQICEVVIVVDAQAEFVARRHGILNVEYVPFVGYDHYHHHTPVVPQDIDVLFTGQSYSRWQKTFGFMGKDRIRYVQKSQKILGKRLLVIGEDWEDVGVRAKGRGLATWEMDGLNRRAKVVLAVDALQLHGFTSPRTFNAMLSGAFVLVAHFPGIENLFRNGTHLVWYRNETELESFLKYYLDGCSEEREMIAREGRRYVQRNGWVFSNVWRYLVDRGVGKDKRLFGEIHAPFQPFRRTSIKDKQNEMSCRQGDREQVMTYFRL